MSEDRIFEVLSATFVADLRKPEIDKFERAAILRTIIDREGETLRGFAARNNIPHTTLYGWLLFNKISEEDYDRKLKSGMSHTQIYNELRKTSSKRLSVSDLDDFEVYIADLLGVIRSVRITRKYSETPRTVSLLKDVVNEINQILVQIELQERARSKITVTPKK